MSRTLSRTEADRLILAILLLATIFGVFIGLLFNDLNIGIIAGAGMAILGGLIQFFYNTYREVEDD